MHVITPYGVHVRNTSTPQRGTWAALVATLREAAGMSKVELARRLNVDRATVMRWENGSTRPEQADVVARFAELFATDLDEALMAAGLLPVSRPVAPRHEPTDPDVLKLLRMLADPDVPDPIKEQVRATLKFLADLADSQPPRKAAPRKRSAG